MLLASLIFCIILAALRSLLQGALRLGHIRGPKSAAYTRFWMMKVLASGDSAAKYVQVNKQYGSLARIGPNHLLTSDPVTTQKILAVRSKYTRGPWFAGSDTTATALRATLLNIVTNPSIYAKLQSEIDFIAATEDESDIVKNDVANQKMPYLQACIKEGLRVFPPITALRERVTPPEGDIIDGHHIPGGVNVGLNMRGVLLNEAFGSDASVFRPERWLEADTKQLNEMKNIHELVFGHGFTRCLGINIAKMNLNKVLFEVGAKFLWRADMILPADHPLHEQLLRRFDIAVVDPLNPWRSRCHGIFFQREFYVRVSSRRSGKAADKAPKILFNA
ncbi:MAG: hypothetical protein Q9171_003762 [Xanthocarpia ochracea]